MLTVTSDEQLARVLETFTRAEDLLRAFDARDEAHLDRRVYKMTECGAWAKLLLPGQRQVGTRRETWSAKFVNSIAGPRCVEMKRGHKAYSLADVPQAVLDYCFVGADGKCSLAWDVLTRSEAVIKLWVRGNVCRVTFEVDVPQYEPHNGGLVLGSTVEGSDAEVSPETLYFPFTRGHFDRAIANIEEEADRLWREANQPEE